MTSEKFDIQLEETGSKGRYFLEIDDETAEMTYSRASPHLIIIDHTEVPDGLRGRGIGEALVRRGIEDARVSGTKIIPLCPFATAQIRRHAEYQDVVSN